MSGSLRDRLVGEGVIAFDRSFGALGSHGGGVAFTESGFECGLIGKAFSNGRIGLLKELLESLAEKKLINHAVDPPLTSETHCRAIWSGSNPTV